MGITELQVQFNGTPAEFGVAVDTLETKIFMDTLSSPFMIFNIPKPDANPVNVQLYSLIPTRRYIGDIVAQKTPNGSILFIRAKKEEWENIQPSWKILRTALEEQGWITSASTAVPDKSITQDNKEPWEIIPDKGSDRKIVELYCQGYPLAQIADTVHLSRKRVSNRLSELRREYDIPKRRTRTG